jgi:cytochrome c-type biogenesis protein
MLDTAERVSPSVNMIALGALDSSLFQAAFGNDRAPLLIALTTGIFTAFNPCGFAMLPGYVSYFIGQTGTDTDSGLPRRLVRASVTGATVTAGFMTVFGAVGLLANQFISNITSAVPYVSMVVGVLLAFLGIAMLRGFEPKLTFLKVKKAKSGSGLLAMYVYGVSYAVVSLSCGFAGFLTTVVTARQDQGFLRSMSTYIAFSLGMGLVLIILSFAVAFAQQAFVRGMRKVIPYVNRASGVMLVVAGLYVAYYGYFEWKTIIREESAPAGPVAWVQDWSGSVLRAVNSASSLTIGTLAIAVVAVIVVAVVRQFRGRSLSFQPSTSGTQTRPALENQTNTNSPGAQ